MGVAQLVHGSVGEAIKQEWTELVRPGGIDDGFVGEDGVGCGGRREPSANDEPHG
jgi:hypothetical protein